MITNERYKLSTRTLIIFSLLQILSYAFIYMKISFLEPHSFHGLSKENNFIDFLYFSIVTFTKTGYGDIYPLTTIARFIVSTELIMGIALLIAIIYCSTGMILVRRKNALDKCPS